MPPVLEMRAEKRYCISAADDLNASRRRHEQSGGGFY